MKTITTRTLSKRSGTEGPHHDPYGYEELIVKCNGFTYKLHLGLRVYFEMTTPQGAKFAEEDEAVATEWFKWYTGLTPDQFGKAYQRLHDCPRRCPHCHGRLRCGSGYVGEAIVFCDNKGCSTNIVWCQDVTEAMIR